MPCDLGSTAKFCVGSKYAPNRPIKASTRSYEEQLELAIAEEERARRNRRVVSHLELQSACK